MQNNKVYNIYTDGCYLKGDVTKGEDKKASWNIVITDYEGQIVEIRSGKLYGTLDSNRAELMSVIQALQYAADRPKSKFVIYTDYDTVILYVEGKNSPKKNNDLYFKISQLMDECKFRVKIQKVKAHTASNELHELMNNYADITAKVSANLFSLAL